MHGEPAEMIGTDVDQIVDAKGIQTLLVCINGLGALPVVVNGRVTPGIVQGTSGLIEAVGRGLEAADVVVVKIGSDRFRHFIWDFVVSEGNVVVSSVSEAGIYKAIGLYRRMAHAFKNVESH